ncbi:MAG: hypothetical protein WCQ52_07575 [Actinomycetes bacterium]
MENTQTYKINGGGSFTVKIDGSTIKIEDYTYGSIAGGTGTECFHTIDATKSADFYAEFGVKDGEELLTLLSNDKKDDWKSLHALIKKFQTDSYVWVETDWSDSIDITVTLTGDAKVGSVLTAVANAISSEGTFPTGYTWYINEELEGTYKVIETAVDQTYTITESDRGKFIRVGVSSGDAVGFNSSFKSSKSVGPVE